MRSGGLHAGVDELLGSGDEIKIELVRNSGLPDACHFRSQDAAKKDRGNSGGQSPGGDSAPVRQGHFQGAGCGTNGNAFQAGGAFDGFDREDFVDGQERGAGASAFCAVYAAV